MFHVEGTIVNSLSEFIYTPSSEAEDFGVISIYCFQTEFSEFHNTGIFKICPFENFILQGKTADNYRVLVTQFREM